MRLMPIKKAYQSSLTSELLLRAPVKSEGLLKAEDDIYMDTKHLGDIKTTGHISIGPNGDVQGNLYARAISVQGNIAGSLSAAETVTLEGGSNIGVGSITSRDIIIQPGCQLKDVKLTTNQ